MPGKRSLTEALLRAIDQALTDLRVCLPARIESYDHTTQRAEVTPMLRRQYADGVVEAMPVIAGVPVVWPRSGGASLTMPVKRGDGVMLVFADRSLDRWLVQGGEVTPDDRRKHHLSDAVAIPGLYSFANPSPQDNNDDVLLQFAGSGIRLSGDGNVVIDTAGSVTVNASAMTINAPLTTTSGINNTGGVVESQGIVLDSHVHGGVETGGGTTGGPQ